MVAPNVDLQKGKTLFLLVYLLVIGGVMVYFMYGLWAAEPRAAQRIAAIAPIHKDGEKPTDGQPNIKLIDPQTVTIGVGQASIRIFGDNFKQTSKVKFNGAERTTHYVNEHQLVVSPVSSDVLAPGAIVITVTNPAANTEKNADEETSNAVTLAVEPAGSITGEWNMFWWQIKIRQEPRLILLVLFTGGLGACMSALQSLADYIGEKKLAESWLTFYVVRPQIGAGIALVFYLVIRGGFLASTNFDAATVNTFGVAAVAALVGMFSDKAILKLREVFLTLFKAEDTRSGKLSHPTITSGPKLPEARVGTLYSQTLTASGGTPPYTWAAVTPPPAWLTLDPATGTLTGTSPAAAPATRYTFQVTDSTGASTTAELEVTVRA